MDNTINQAPEVQSEQTSSQTPPTNNKKSSNQSIVLIVIEIFLLLAVIALVIFYFNRRNNVKVNITNPTTNQYTINEAGETVSVPVSEVVVDTPIIPPLKVVKTEVTIRMSAPVPAQSSIIMEDSIPQGAIKIDGIATGFSPQEFTVEAGEEVTLALTSKISLPVVLTFYSPDMAAISIGCGPGESRFVTFKAPTKAGEYIFRNDIIGHTNETGKMIVK